jgi:hypothetical protein
MNIHRRGHSFLSLLGIATPPLTLALLGLTHPHDLTPATAQYWYTLHLILLPLFPLLAVNLWWLLASVSSPWAWLARILACVYIPFYGALDVLERRSDRLIRLRCSAGFPRRCEIGRIELGARQCQIALVVGALA